VTRKAQDAAGLSAGGQSKFRAFLKSDNS
jgi:hypothetical protein